MEPIAPIIETAHQQRSPARGTLADAIATVLASMAAITVFIYSTVFFFSFLENDTHIWGILSAFLLCFGVGAFAYIPATLTGLIAWKAYKKGAEKKPLLWAILLLLPWICLSLALFFVSDMAVIYSAPTLITVTLLTAWALISLRNLHKR
ncbi:hypothetical protein [Hellea balneolensis]|uniref:hypothetical protein n=1 Tax=Hellea balneolensis TaxID=287478 RepID=UPI00041DC256|nr:hypothetical protein [Hellea balneolensis]